MKKTMLAVLALVFTLTMLTACNQGGGTKVAVLDEATAFKSNKAAMAAMAYLKGKGDPMQKVVEAAYKAMQAKKTPETTKAYKDAFTELQKVMGTEQQRVVKLLNAEFEKILTKYRTDNGITVVISRQYALAYDGAVDITKAIVAEMDKINIDYAATAPKAAPKKADDKKADKKS